MMRSIIYIIFLTIPNLLLAQSFETNFSFYDSNRRTDTLTLGYASNATDSLDVALGEKNLEDSQIDTTFFVCASNVIAIEKGNFMKANYRTKKQIVHLIRADYIRYARVDLICKSFPITVKWDKQLFQDTSCSNSFIIISPPGGWFDVGEGPFALANADSLVLLRDNFNNTGFYYADSIHQKKVNIWKLYIGFVSKGYRTGVPDYKQLQFSTYPNPCQDYLHITFSTNEERTIQLFNLSGKVIYSSKVKGYLNEIDLSAFEKGTYLLKVSSGNSYIVEKIIKIGKL